MMRKTYKQTLEQLHASEELKQRVLDAAAQEAPTRHAPLWAAVAVAALVLAYALLSLPGTLKTPPVSPIDSNTPANTATTADTAPPADTTTTTAAPAVPPLNKQLLLTDTQAQQMRDILARQDWRPSVIKGVPEYMFMLDGKEYWLHVADGWCNNRGDSVSVLFSEDDQAALQALLASGQTDGVLVFSKFVNPGAGGNIRLTDQTQIERILTTIRKASKTAIDPPASGVPGSVLSIVLEGGDGNTRTVIAIHAEYMECEGRYYRRSVTLTNDLLALYDMYNSAAAVQKLEQLKGDSGTYWLFAKGDRYGIMTEDGEEVAPAQYAYFQKLADDRVEVRTNAADDYGAILNERGEVVMSNTTFTKFGEGRFTNKNWGEETFEKPLGSATLRLIRPADAADTAVTQSANGFDKTTGPFVLKDMYGKTYGDRYDLMAFTDRAEVVGQNGNGYFLLDLNGKVLRKLDDVEVVAEQSNERFSVTRKYVWDGNFDGFSATSGALYGLRTANGKTILETKFNEVKFLSDTRFVGLYLTPHAPDGALPAYTCIVDEQGKVICDKYHHLLFAGSADTTYPYAVADVSDGKGACTYYVIDWDGKQVLDEAFTACGKPSGHGIVELTRTDGSTVRVSLQTGQSAATASVNPADVALELRTALFDTLFRSGYPRTYAGSWLDLQTGALVVGVTDEQAIADYRAAVQPQLERLAQTLESYKEDNFILFVKQSYSLNTLIAAQNKVSAYLETASAPFMIALDEENNHVRVVISPKQAASLRAYIAAQNLPADMMSIKEGDVTITPA